MPRKRKVVIYTLIIVGACLVLVPLVTLALLADDWSRDFTTNVAETSADASDPDLRPLTVHATFDEIDAATHAIGTAEPDWQYVGAKPSTSGGTIRMVHVTRLMRYRDDVTLSVTLGSDGNSTIAVRSASRIGKGDLGQNPRNIKRLRMLLEQQISQ